MKDRVCYGAERTDAHSSRGGRTITPREFLSLLAQSAHSSKGARIVTRLGFLPLLALISVVDWTTEADRRKRGASQMKVRSTSSPSHNPASAPAGGRAVGTAEFEPVGTQTLVVDFRLGSLLRDDSGVGPPPCSRNNCILTSLPFARACAQSKRCLAVVVSHVGACPGFKKHLHMRRASLPHRSTSLHMPVVGLF